MRLTEYIRDAKNYLAIHWRARKLAWLTGIERDTAARLVTEQLVDETVRDMELIGFGAAEASRIVGRAMGLLEDYHLSWDEGAFAQSRVGELAAAKLLAKEGFWDLDLARRYAHTGYQRLMAPVDPLIAHLRSSYHEGPLRESDFDQVGLAVQLESSGPEDLRKFVKEVWEYLDREKYLSQVHPEAHRLWCLLVTRNINQAALDAILDLEGRFAVHADKRSAIEQYWP